MINTPRLEIYTSRIVENTKYIINNCHSHGIKVAFVTKVLCGEPKIARAVLNAGADFIADSRIENIKKIINSGLTAQYMLLRLPALSEASEVIKWADISLNSSLKVIKELGKEAKKQNKIHKVIIMIDVGDLREGIMPDKAVDLIYEASKTNGIEVIGTGCNLACYGGVIPSKENMSLLVEITKECQKKYGLPLPIISGGNSSGLPIMFEGNLPKEINLYRIGESIILGRNVIDRSPLQGTRQDTVIAVAEVIELEKKPSMPIGKRGQDAFGEISNIKDRGFRLRAICNLGRQDSKLDGLKPELENIQVLGGSSDHLILDVTECKSQIQVGDEIRFYPDYGALLALSTSEYVKKVVL